MRPWASSRVPDKKSRCGRLSLCYTALLVDGDTGREQHPTKRRNSGQQMGFQFFNNSGWLRSSKGTCHAPPEDGGYFYFITTPLLRCQDLLLVGMTGGPASSTVDHWYQVMRSSPGAPQQKKTKRRGEGPEDADDEGLAPTGCSLDQRPSHPHVFT